MQPLPRNFLIDIAQRYELSPEQREAFVERFSSKKNEEAIAEVLHISANAFRTRMSGVYQKFSIGGRGPGKAHRLHDVLVQEYEKFKLAAQEQTESSIDNFPEETFLFLERPLKIAPESIKKAKQSLINLATNEKDLADEVKIPYATCSDFFNGRPISSEIFIQLSKKLCLEWQEIRDDIDDVVQDVQEQVAPHILKRCGNMRVLQMEHPIELGSIYTSVNILKKITSHQRFGIAQLMENCNLQDFERFGLAVAQEKRVPGLEAVERHRKLMILGKPGAGKTTFLKYLAIQCSNGCFQAGQVPIFITLKDFAEEIDSPSLIHYINQQFHEFEVKDSQAVEKILRRGRSLILLDGLDEVRENDHDRVLREIRSFLNRFSDCQFVMTCRIAAHEYTFENFTEVEVADFDWQQIVEFSNKWFQTKEDLVKAERFIQSLGEHEPIQELATNPLLLTLLCLVFEDSADFPANRAELYKEGLDVLLKKWDAKRNIERKQIYKKLSIKRKQDLLREIAFSSFSRNEYFFKQNLLEQQISDYIRNLPDVSTDPDALQLDSEAVLKSIEAQHGLLVERARGIYSFSHLTFQEYFSAQKLYLILIQKN